MKKIILVLLVILSLVIALPSCNNVEETNPDFVLINELLDKGFEHYTVTIDIENTDSKITESYDVTVDGDTKTVEYKVERYSMFEIFEDGTISIPSDYITVSEGTLTTDEEGKYDIPDFDFSYDSLESERVIGKILKANIISMSSFAGSYVKAIDAKVAVEFTSNAVNNIVITFTTGEGQSVTVTYTFN